MCIHISKYMCIHISEYITHCNTLQHTATHTQSMTPTLRFMRPGGKTTFWADIW